MRTALYLILLSALTGPAAMAEMAPLAPVEEELADAEHSGGDEPVENDGDDLEEEPAGPIPEDFDEPNAALSGTSGAPRVAPNLDLKEVAPTPIAAQTARPDLQDPDAAVRAGSTPGTAPLPESPLPEDEAVAAATQRQEHLNRTPSDDSVSLSDPLAGKSLVILGSEVKPGTATRLGWSPDTAGAGLSRPTPVLIVNGEGPGPTLCLTAAVHGDELNGIEIVRRVMYDIDPSALSGRLIGVPIVNVQGFQQGSRYLPDRRDLNRNFPGDPAGSLAGRVAHSFFNEVIGHCDMLVDIHTGSLKRTNLPQLRADMNNTAVAEFTRGFDGMAVVHGSGSTGMLRTAAIAAGITAVTLEAGESHRIQKDQIKAGVNSIISLLERQKMISRLFVWGDPEPIYYQSNWVRTDEGGILSSEIELGDDVVAGELLGVVTDPITNERYEIVAKENGRVIGMAVDQVVMAGFATYHIGTKARGPSEE